MKSAQPEEFDLVILGGGTGSTIAAWTFGAQRQRVAVIDRKYIGGSCPNIACLPSKNIIHSAKVASYVRHSVDFGIACDSFKVDMHRVRDRKRLAVRAHFHPTIHRDVELTGFPSGGRIVQTDPLALEHDDQEHAIR